MLKPGGLFLNHGITSEAGWRRTPLTRFMNQYIFPDGELARIGDVVGAMERQGFEILDLESLRPHYPLTLRHWLRALCARHDAVIAVSARGDLSAVASVHGGIGVLLRARQHRGLPDPGRTRSRLPVRSAAPR
ncbi:MAG: class I SAM-dependent methyltransferase [Chromatiales bacterium]|nr:class I SAM-dependent methyltransferase [Chromatiales bacterium]